ncbi:MAG TPA: copper resistance CopC family protein [Micromonosporaceae bacterium]|nr:copper resistance CopC family protein [Micromonosporaceae bacterium]
MALVAVVGVLGALVLAQPAAAHNSLTGSDPKDGARLARPPAVVRLVFLSRLDPASTTVVVTGPDGRRAQAGTPRFDGPRVVIPVAPGPAGRYTVSYEIVSSDGHPVKGAIGFTVTTPSAPTSTSAPTGAGPAAATPSPSAAAATASRQPAVPAPTATTRDARTPLWLALVAAGVLAALVGGALAVRRGRRGG